MPAVKTQHKSKVQTDSVQAVWRSIRTQLECAQQRVIGEISNYPAPRPNCDADFNHLLETRARISDDLNRLQAIASNTSSGQHVAEFISTSAGLDDADRRKIRSRISKLPR